ncbi:MAG: tetratricopeptide repeat protein [Saprospiraceae bacterium]|nr:tetratricopeptide repeat protein [Saprospiraceae bacterium]
MRFIYTVITFLFVAQLSSAQENAYRQLPSDSTLAWLAENYVENPENFHEKALASLDHAYQSGDERLMAESHLLLMRWHAYHVLFTIDSIYYHGDRAIPLFEKINDQKKLAAIYAELAIEHIEGNNLEKSEALIFKALEIYEALGDDWGQGNSYCKMSNIFYAQQEYELSIKYGLKALEITEQSQDFSTHSQSWLILTKAYHKAGELEKAIEAANKCIETLKTHVPDEVFDLARAYGYRGNIWSDLGEFQKALEDNLQSYAIVEAEIGAERPATKTYRDGIGMAYYMQGNYQGALPHLEAALDGYLSLGQGNKPFMQELYTYLADCYYQLGNYQKAYANQQLAHAVFDTLIQDRVANLESEALFKYESGKKDQAIADQATTISQKNRLQWLGAGFICLLLLFLGTLLYYFRRNQKNMAALSAKNKENELLLKEIHHRVKNNLQVISSLLNIQSRNIEDIAVKNAILESQSRVQSMSLIHQKLYRGQNLAAIEMKSYFQTLADNLIDTYSEDEVVEIKVDMQNLELDVDYAIPLGLIANELITNSLKYAFPKGKKGAIEIKMKQNQDEIILDISDNGVGAGTTETKKEDSGFGSELIELLTMQLKGKLEATTVEGYHTRLRFPVAKLSQVA